MPSAPKTAKKQTSSSWLETVKTLVYAGLIALGIRTVAFEPFNIPSASMVPTLRIGDFVFVSKYSYGYSRYSMPFAPALFSGRIFGSLPHRGDVAVFRYTRDTSIDYIKRVIGLPGDHVQVKGGELYINGTLVPRQPIGDFEAPANDDSNAKILTKEYVESLPDGPKHLIIKYSDDPNYSIGGELDPNNTPEYVVPAGDLFMMGDNRDNSSDSRFQNDLGFVPTENLVGKAQFIFFSFDAEYPWWEVWMWPFEVRWGRLLKPVV